MVLNPPSGVENSNVKNQILLREDHKGSSYQQSTCEDATFELQYWQKEMDILFCSITPTNLGQLSKPGTDLKSAGPDVFKTPPTCPI